MPSYHRQVRTAIWEAEKLGRNAIEWKLPRDNPFLGLDHDEPILLYDHIDEEPNCIYTKKSEDFRHFYEELAKLSNGVVTVEAGMAIRDHEEQHNNVAQLLDPTNVNDSIWGLRFEYDNATELFTTHGFVVKPNLRTTKLGLAILRAYPEAGGGPSEGDIWCFKSIGYDSISSIAKLAIKRGMPIPLTYQLADSKAL